MRIATLASAWVFLAWFPIPPGAARAPGPDAWVTLPEEIPPFGNSPHIVSDSARNLYFVGPEGAFLLEDGRLRALPLPEAPGFHFSLLLPRSEQEYWVGMAGPRPDGKTQKLLFRNRAGQWARYDSGTACSQGIPLGLDAAGHPILELRTSLSFATTTQGVFRLVDGQCQAIPLGIARNAEMVATRYFRDSRGREYFALHRRSDVPGCGGFVRLGDTLERYEILEVLRDSLGTSEYRVPLCVEDFDESGDTVFLASAGLGILTDTLAHVRAFGGVAAGLASDVLRDSRGFLWLGTEGYGFSPPPLGLVQIKGTDTTLMHKHNSGLPTLYPRELWEDKAGNIWVRLSEGGYAVYLREGNPMPLGLASRATRWRPGPNGNPDRGRDFLGRKAHPARRPAFRAWMPPFP